MILFSVIAVLCIVDWSEEDGESTDDCATGSEAERASTDDERECLI